MRIYKLLRYTIDRTKLPVSFDMSGTVSGNGTMILKHGIDLAGVRKKDLIRTQPGEVTISESLDLKSTTDHVNITATVQEDNATMNITEAWPTSLIDETEIKMAAFVAEPKEEVSEVWLPCPCGDT